MYRSSLLLTLASVFVLCPSPTAAQLQVPDIPIDTFTLDNGLRVIVSEDHSAPVVSVHMWYHVGSADEEVGRSGFAHLFEHMLFEETENLDDGDFRRYVNEAGGTFNGSTTNDRTNYFEIMPSNRVNLALWLHAERMGRLVVSERGFETQRSVVKEERRQRIDNQPYGSAQLAMDTLSTDYVPYKHTVIGSMDDLDAAQVTDVRAFHDRLYVPNNAVLTVVGDVTTVQIRELVGEYFGDFERGPVKPALPAAPPTPRTDGERRMEIDDPLAQLPLALMAYNIPPADHEDVFALSILSSIFSEGESSRLHVRLVKEEKIAPVVISALNTRVGPGLFFFGSLPNQGSGVEEIEAILQEEIELLQEEGVTSRELEKAINNVRASQVTGRLTVNGKANAIQSAVLNYGDPFRVNTNLARYENVSLADILRVARTYLTPENRTVVIARPATRGISEE
ncbi:MAG: pitrilysin family protein [Gemmatimonadota bacterium]